MKFLKVNPELQSAINKLQELAGSTSYNLTDLAGARAMDQAISEQRLAAEPKRKSVNIATQLIYDEAMAIEVEIQTYGIESTAPEKAGILFIHGGGYIFGRAQDARVRLSEWCEELDVFIVCVEYRLAPETPFPGALNDCYAALKWLFSNASDVGVDAQRIAIVGESAGGGLAAGLALYARDHSDLKVAFQLLIFPMIDHTNIEPASDQYPDTYIWNRQNNRFAWDAYLGQQLSPDMLQYAAPSSATDLTGLPPTFIPVGESDLFFAEDKEYAQRLSAAGIDVDFKTYADAYHAFATIVPEAKISKQFNLDIKRALRDGLSIDC
ncbi:MAG: acetyl esterase/lipase [Arenicella sp.]